MTPKMRRARKPAIIAGLAAVVALVAWYAWPKKGKTIDGGESPTLVSVTIARAMDLPVKFSSQGHLVPLNQVDIRPQISGRIHAIHFSEGQDIRTGQLLFTLDDSELQAQLNRARAQATQIRTQLDVAQRALDRANELVGTGYISSSSLDTVAGNVKLLEAQRKAALADIESARVQLGYTRIVSPISAKAGAIQVRPGSLAQPGDALPMVSLLQFDPIGVEFTLPEQSLNAVLGARAAGQARVEVETPSGETQQGELIFINNTVNQNTGTINLKASFGNDQNQLWPGAFVRVVLDAGVDKGVMVLPPQAVLEGPTGHFVFNVDAAGKVSSHPVTLLRTQDQHAVVSGVADGEQVVVEGNQDLHAGEIAKIVPAAGSGAAPGPAR